MSRFFLLSGGRRPTNVLLPAPRRQIYLLLPLSQARLPILS